MKRVALSALVTALLVLVATSAFAQEEAVEATAPEPADDGYSTHVIGGTVSIGSATIISENCNNCGLRLAGGGGAFYNMYVTKMFALHAGVGMMGRGVKTALGDEQKIKILYMDIPIGVKLRFNVFQIAAGVSLDFALSGKYDPGEKFEDADWEIWARRFNLGAWFGMGWAIPAGPIKIVPGLSFNTHLLNEVTLEGANVTVRPLNFMIDIDVEFGLKN